MSDCTNAEIRDRLPDMIHDRVDARERAAVLAHVATCAECRAELDILRSARAMFAARTPNVDIGRIVSALPAPASARTARRRVVDWRIAAAITVLAVGGGSIAVVTRGGSDAVRRDSVTLASVPRGESATATIHIADSQRATQPAPRVPTTPAPDAQTGLAMTGGFADLSEAQLEALLKEIDQLEAVPTTEPDPIVLPVSTTRPATPRGGA